MTFRLALAPGCSSDVAKERFSCNIGRCLCELAGFLQPEVSLLLKKKKKLIKNPKDLILVCLTHRLCSLLNLQNGLMRGWREEAKKLLQGGMISFVEKENLIVLE